MSQTAQRFSISRQQVQARLNRLRKSHRQGMLGVAEAIGLAGGALMLLAVFVGYLYFLVPARSQATSLARDRDLRQKHLRGMQADFDRGQSTKATVQKITDSLDDFENNRLVDRNAGRMFLYEELNQLIRKNALRNSSGPTYALLDPIDTATQERAAPASKSAAAKWQSIYPGIAVNLTVEGPYQTLRHFVRDLESSKSFITINAVELERATESNAQLSPDGSAKSANAPISLRLDLATYFQRPANDVSPDQTQAH